MENLNNLAPFYVGQKAVCIKHEIDEWIDENTGQEMSGPKANEIIIVSKCFLNNNKWEINLIGYGNHINDSFNVIDTNTGRFLFKPIQEQSFPLIKLSKVIEKEKQLVSAN